MSLTHQRHELDAPDRREQHNFVCGKLTDVGCLIDLVDRSNYIGLECTGFAQSESLPGRPAGTQGGILSFEEAVAAGRERLSKDIFQYALDIATLHELGVHPFNPVIKEMLDVIRSATKLDRAKEFTALPAPELSICFDKLLTARYALFGGRERELTQLKQFPAIAKTTKTNAGRWSRSASACDLPTIAKDPFSGPARCCDLTNMY